MNPNHFTEPGAAATVRCKLCEAYWHPWREEEKGDYPNEPCTRPRNRLFRTRDWQELNKLYEYGYKLVSVVPDTLKAGEYVYILELLQQQ